jgi:hypothetical protein
VDRRTWVQLINGLKLQGGAARRCWDRVDGAVGQPIEEAEAAKKSLISAPEASTVEGSAAK